jgi:hypothetical protein
MGNARLSSAMVVATLCRQVQAAGGFAAVLRRGDDRAGAILVECVDRGTRQIILERATGLDGEELWRSAAAADLSPEAHTAMMQKRLRADPDMWVVELDIADAERFTAALFE